MFVRLKTLPVLLLALALAPSAIFAQGFGTIVGTVTDASGAVINSAKIKVTGEATDASRETNANEQGYFVVPSLRPGDYTVTFEAPGFTTVIKRHIALQA